MMSEKKLLIVDDEALVRQIIEDSLEDLDYTIFHAGDAKEAFHVLETERVQVMLFDLKMPGMNGVDLCAKVKTLYPATIIYAMSGYRSLFDLVGCLSAGFEDYFAKPFEITTIRDEVEHAFAKLQRWKTL